MQTICVASKNPLKLRAAEDGFRRLFPGQDMRVEGVSVPSGVSDQPMDDAETLLGAENRARRARDAQPEADLWIGLEGGIEDQDGALVAFAWVAVWDGERMGRSRTASLELPPRVAELVRGGKELGEADDIVFGRSNSKQTTGAAGLLTDGAIDRAALYSPAVLLALIPFKRPDLYPLDPGNPPPNG